MVCAFSSCSKRIIDCCVIYSMLSTHPTMTMGTYITPFELTHTLSFADFDKGRQTESLREAIFSDVRRARAVCIALITAVTSGIWTVPDLPVSG